MGENRITEKLDHAEMRLYVCALLEDLRALERMLVEGRFERGVQRVGAEQELFLVDLDLRPKACVLPVLERLKERSFTTELAQYNLEANLSPQELSGGSLARMEAELVEMLDLARAAAASEDARVLFCGILPTLEKQHLGLEWMTPIPRYYQLNRMMSALRNGRFDTRIKGLDEFHMIHDNLMLEACNTSFQLHWQCEAERFAMLYNLAQLVSAPLLACAVNSPILMGHRLWHETRVALFQQSVDTRSEIKAQRGNRSRVSFGDRWVESSVMEIFHEDVARFRSLISAVPEESAMEVLDRGGVPELKALRIHNGTIYRWNRPCYGVIDGRAHLRIENRVLPAGPTVVDELANAAFFFGLMSALPDEYEDVRAEMSFDDAKSNLVTAARYGLRSNLRWLRGRTWATEELVLDHLLPLARKGLDAARIDSADVDRLLGVLEERVRSGRTGAQWALDSFAAMGENRKKPERCRALAAATLKNQEEGRPVAQWELAALERGNSAPDRLQTVEQVMTSDVFTLHPEDPADLAACLMDWEHLHCVPVEDQSGHVLGMLSYRSVLQLISRDRAELGVPVREIMDPDPPTIRPEATTLEALRAMRAHDVATLAVVNRKERLVGVVTEHDLLQLAAALLDERPGDRRDRTME
jgi:CBS domain-containing protein